MSVGQMRILGIDVAKAKLDVALLLPDGKSPALKFAQALNGISPWSRREDHPCPALFLQRKTLKQLQAGGGVCRA